MKNSLSVGIGTWILVKNEGEYILTKIYVYGVTLPAASDGGNIEKFRPPRNRENHEKLVENEFFQRFLWIIFRPRTAPIRYSDFQNLEVFPHPKIPKSVAAHGGRLCTTRLKKW